VWLMALFHKRHAETRIAVNYAGKWATALIMLSLALLMATSESWPLAIFALGTAVSLVAGALYSLKPREVA
jgi:phosphatidylglycerophosphate synthase